MVSSTGAWAALKHQVANGFVMQLSAYRWDALGCVEVGPRNETGNQKLPQTPIPKPFIGPRPWQPLKSQVLLLTLQPSNHKETNRSCSVGWPLMVALGYLRTSS